jgi:hypothetical protein
MNSKTIFALEFKKLSKLSKSSLKIAPNKRFNRDNTFVTICAVRFALSSTNCANRCATGVAG